ncbi:MAG: hypothetical protein ACYDAK_12145 [Candidatus Limnocylindrales bacterium]
MSISRRIASGAIGLATIVALAASPAGVAAADPTTTTTTTPTTTVTPTTCTDGVWPKTVDGRPARFEAGAAAGDYIWHDATGWHVRVTHPGSATVVFTGRVVSSAPLTAVPVLLEAQDTITVSADRRTITYRLVDHGGIDGFDFTTACARQVGFYGAMADHRLPVGRIWLGDAGRHPLENPFVVRRLR